ncbi:MAG: hypothetical protein R3B72_35225 [Polyangiaceae bacterium]
MTTTPFPGDLIDTLASALGAVHEVMAGPRQCLPQCYLLRRVLAAHQPGHPFTLCLGGLRVDPLDGAQSMLFDPRTDVGIDINAGFHAWLEDEDGRMVDPSILWTLVAEGYAVDPTEIVVAESRRFVGFGLGFTYERLTELVLVGMEASEPHIARLERWVRLAMLDIEPPPLEHGVVALDVEWRP